jgi:hypothetical protein
MDEEIEVGGEGEGGAAPVVSTELEASRKEAKRFGHQSLEDWTSAGKDPAAWVDADVFLKRGQEYNGYLRQQNERLQTQINELGESLHALQDHHTKVAERAYEKALKTLKDSRKQALKEGNLEAVAELEEAIEAAAAEKPKVPAGGGTQLTAADAERDFNSWLTQNRWYAENERAHVLAQGIKGKYEGKLFGRAFLDAVTADVRRLMPEVFENPARRAAAAVDSGGTRGVTSKTGNSYSDLPADAKKECDRLSRKGPDGKIIMTKEQYLKEYYELEDE